MSSDYARWLQFVFFTVTILCLHLLCILSLDSFIIVADNVISSNNGTRWQWCTVRQWSLAQGTFENVEVEPSCTTCLKNRLWNNQ